MNLAGSGATSVAPDLVNEQTEERDYVGAAQTIALNALAVRAKSRGELAAQLKRRGIPLDVADDVLDRLQRSGLINDLDFARAWSTDRKSTRLNSSHMSESRMPSSA